MDFVKGAQLEAIEPAENVAVLIKKSRDDSDEEDKMDGVEEAKQPVDEESNAEDGGFKAPSLPAPKPPQQDKPPVDETPPEKEQVTYVEPSWGGESPPDDEPCYLEVLKNGSIINKINLTDKSFFTIGRAVSSDIQLEHPSISRLHAVLQYSRDRALGGVVRGWHLFGMGSTHGTEICKHRLKEFVYQPLKTGYVIKFGLSTRVFVFQNQSDEVAEQEAKRQVTVDEAVEERLRAKKPTAEDDEGISWGIQLDDSVVYKSASIQDSIDLEKSSLPPLALQDPKKTLRGFYEREGLELPQYDCIEVASGKFRCEITLPIDDEDGKAVVVSVTVSGSKKEAARQCAIEACHTLDRHGVLRQQASSRKKIIRRHDEDYYSSDDDLYLDRTGQIEAKRQQRMKREVKRDVVYSEQGVKDELKRVKEECLAIEQQLAADEVKSGGAGGAASQMDSLEGYMANLKEGGLTATDKSQLKLKLMDLRKEQMQLERIYKKINPAAIVDDSSISSKQKQIYSSIGKRFSAKPIQIVSKLPKLDDDDESSEEEDDGDEEKKSTPRISLLQSQISSHNASNPTDAIISRQQPLKKTIIIKAPILAALKRANDDDDDDS